MLVADVSYAVCCPPIKLIPTCIIINRYTYMEERVCEREKIPIMLSKCNIG